MPGYIEGLLKQKIDTILKSIADNGLNANSEDKNRLRSADKAPATRLSVNFVEVRKAQSQENIDKMINGLVFSGTQGIWSILLERAYQSGFSYSTLEDRLNSSMVFLLAPPAQNMSVYDAKDNIVSTNWDDSSFISSPLTFLQAGFKKDSPLGKEIQTSHVFKKNEILAILAPISKCDTIKIFFPNILVIPAGSKSDAFTTSHNLFNIKKLPKLLRLNGPDYKKAIHDFLNATKYKRFSCHVTRLPTAGDLFELNAKNTKEILEFYKVSDLNTAISIAEKQEYKLDVDYLVTLGANSTTTYEKRQKEDLEYDKKRAEEDNIKNLHDVAANFPGLSVKELLDMQRKQQIHKGSTAASVPQQLPQYSASGVSSNSTAAAMPKTIQYQHKLSTAHQAKKIFIAAQKNDTKLIQELSSEVPANYIIAKCTALHYACKNGHIDAIMALEKLGWDININSGHEKTPLQILQGDEAYWKIYQERKKFTQAFLK